VSIPEVGSSSITIFEFPIIAIATESFLFYPPDKVLAS
jgi:hypothetical protein